MKRYFTIITFFILTLTVQAQDKPEVLYRIDTHNFFDSNDDGPGDLKGIQQKMNYLEQLGVTAILLAPVYEQNLQGYSDNDLMLVNPKYGLLADYRNVVAEAHKKSMKVYQEINLQYVGIGHAWFKESFKKPASGHSRFIYYADNKNEKPVYLKEKSVAINLREPKVLEYMLGMLKQWADPNKDKVFNDGVDGFVLDMADKTPDAPKLTNLYKDFWIPLTEGIKAYNPKIKIIGQDMESLAKSGSEKFFSGKLEKAIASLDKKKISTLTDTVFKQVPGEKQILITVPRIEDNSKQKIASAITFLLGATPVLQAGQETGNNAVIDWKIAEEQSKDPNSVLNSYKQLIKAYKVDPGLSSGKYKEIVASNNEVLAFTRTYKNLTTLVTINLTGAEQPLVITEQGLKLNAAKVIFGDPVIVFPKGGRTVTLPGYGVQLWRIVTGPSK